MLIRINPDIEIGNEIPFLTVAKRGAGKSLQLVVLSLRRHPASQMPAINHIYTMIGGFRHKRKIGLTMGCI